MKIEILAFFLVFTISRFVATEESANAESKKRSNTCNPRDPWSNIEPLAMFGKDGECQEPNPEAEGHDNRRKRIKRNPSPEVYSPPSALSKNSSDTRPSSLDDKSSQTLPAVKLNWKEDPIQLGSIGLMAAEQLSKKQKIGGIYEAIRVHREGTVKRLRELCNEEPSIDVGIEMADAASLLKLMNSSTDENIESAGQEAHRGALLLLQAEILRQNGLQLLSESQNSFKYILSNISA